MQVLLYVLVIAGSSCLAHYAGYDSRNLIERDEPAADVDGELVECPVCGNVDHWMPSREECPFVRGNKKYKRCELGVYVNEVCGNRPDCYRGPGEQCTESMDIDIYGQKCAAGYACNKPLGVCTGMGYVVDSNKLRKINPLHRYPLRAPTDM